jgi:hypothetical protein
VFARSRGAGHKRAELQVYDLRIDFSVARRGAEAVVAAARSSLRKGD